VSSLENIVKAEHMKPHIEIHTVSCNHNDNQSQRRRVAPNFVFSDLCIFTWPLHGIVIFWCPFCFKWPLIHTMCIILVVLKRSLHCI